MPRTERVSPPGSDFYGQAGQVLQSLYRPAVFGRREQSGFSLIEVLVAFVLLSLTLAVVLQLFSSGLQNAGAAARYAQAMILAESKLAQLDADQPLTAGNFQGQEEPFTWQLDITPYIEPGPTVSEDEQRAATALLEVTLTVRWQQGRREPALTLNTLRLVQTP